MLADTYGWQWYGGHHMENRTAYFGNNYWLPKKLGKDLRSPEYSGMIRSGYIDKENALKSISKPLTIEQSILDEVCTRLNITQKQLNTYFENEPSSYKDFKTYKETFIRLRPLFYLLYKKNFVTRSFYEKFCFKN
jgi:hypothetical protein